MPRLIIPRFKIRILRLLLNELLGKFKGMYADNLLLLSVFDTLARG